MSDDPELDIASEIADGYDNQLAQIVISVASLTAASLDAVRPATIERATHIAFALLNWATQEPVENILEEDGPNLTPKALAWTVNEHLPILGWNPELKYYWLQTGEELKAGIKEWREVGAFMAKTFEF